MKLTIARNQTQQTDRKGRSEGAFFEFSCRLQLESHDQELVDRYGQTRYPITFIRMDDIRDWRPRNDDDRIITVASLVEGWSGSSRFSTDLRRVEATIIDGCAEFNELLLSMESYGGQEEIQF